MSLFRTFSRLLTGPFGGFEDVFDGLLDLLWPLPPEAQKRMPVIKFFSQATCDALEKLYEQVDQLIVYEKTISQHPETLRVRAFTARNNIWFMDFTETAEFQALDRHVQKIYASPLLNVHDKPSNREWCELYGDLFEAVKCVFILLRNPQNHGRLPAILDKRGMVGCPYNGPTSGAEWDSAFKTHADISCMFLKREAQLRTKRNRINLSDPTPL